MVSTDPIADMFSRIRNAIAAGKNEVLLPHSQIKEKVAKLLVATGFLLGVGNQDFDGRLYLKITINDEYDNAKISSIKRLSRPGQRRYVRTADIPTVKRGRGLVIMSTSSGIMTGDQAKTKGLGGELIGEVY